MNDNRSYIRYTWFVVIMVLLVIIAGAIVRTTQSGMGCPDWPKCFGRWIPPTNASQLPPDYEKYLKQQDIDHSFNVYRTWTEYINRLVSTLLGFVILIHLAWSGYKFWRTDRKIVWLSILLLITVGFQAWLGKKVVDTNLAVAKITTHMLVALVVAAIPLIIIYRLKAAVRVSDRFLKITSLLVLAALMIQVAFGTDVRQQVDDISKSLSYSQRELWIDRLDNIFLIHRSFSWIILVGTIGLFWKGRKYLILRTQVSSILLLAILGMALGIAMAKFNIPAALQPLHLLVASLLVLSVFALRLRIK